MAAWEWILIIILILASLVAIGYLVYYFWFVSKGAAEGQPCGITQVCAPKLFCSGANTCQSGAKGVASGGSCTNSNQCDFGLKCDSSSKTCLSQQ
mgnify:CR=1 FL=1